MSFVGGEQHDAVAPHVQQVVLALRVPGAGDGQLRQHHVQVVVVADQTAPDLAIVARAQEYDLPEGLLQEVQRLVEGG